MRSLLLLVFISVCALLWFLQQRRRRLRFDRGRRLTIPKPRSRTQPGLRWGSVYLPFSAATQHFLAVGTTGSGKSLVQRRLMRDVLPAIHPGTDARALIFDAKNDIVPFLAHIGVRCPVYSLNPFEARNEFPCATAWDIASDVTSPARAMNLAACLIPQEGGGTNRYFTDAARQVVAALAESFIRHSPRSWTFADFVFATLSARHLEELLVRDDDGKQVFENFFGDDRTGYQVFTTIASRMNYYRPVAALWQRAACSLSIRRWLEEEAIVLLGMNATAQVALNAINEVIFRILVEEIDNQSDSSSRRTWIWVDEARLSGPILRGPLLPYLAVKGRSRGACLVLAFQDIEGFREAAGPRIANEIIAQCSHKALLRLESEESAQWASRLLGQYETLDIMHSRSSAWLKAGENRSEQLARRDAVLASEFYDIPVTTAKNGLSGYFVSPCVGAVRSNISGRDLFELFVTPELGHRHLFISRPECDQWMRPWTDDDRVRLQIARPLQSALEIPANDQQQLGRLKLRSSVE